MTARPTSTRPGSSRAVTMAVADVTICIPAWKAEPFIDRTLRCARAQTHAGVRILVSVDQCDDRTAAICREHAGQDPRVAVIAQAQRVGWSENANYLLDRVETDFFFLYFHDDVIEPTYTEKLRQALLDNPRAVSAHCDLEYFGLQRAVDLGHTFAGPPARRIINYLVRPVKGTQLRSLTRTELVAKGLRFPAIGEDGFWRCPPYSVRLVGEGEAVRVPEVLYRRWIREGSLTKTWRPQEMSQLVDGLRECARVCEAIIGELVEDADAKQVARFCLYLSLMTYLRRAERTRSENEGPVDAAAISPSFAAFADASLPAELEAQDAEVHGWISTAKAELKRAEREAYLTAELRRQRATIERQRKKIRALTEQRDRRAEQLRVVRAKRVRARPDHRVR
jgi:glycosyltransferase involved in cell wall biosynthesis